MAVDTLGVVEVNSIAAGVELADGMVKVADVELVRAATLCSGRFIIHVAGRSRSGGNLRQFSAEPGRNV